MTTRTIRTRLAAELAFPGHHRKQAERVGAAVADLHRLTLEAFADVEPMGYGLVSVTVYATAPRRDGHYRPRRPDMAGIAVYPVFQALNDAGLIRDYDVALSRRYVQSPDEERIEVQFVPYEEAAA